MLQELHVITPIYRPANIPAIYHSIEDAAGPDRKITWWPIFDNQCAQEGEKWRIKFSRSKKQNLFINCLVSEVHDELGNLHKNHILDLLDNPEQPEPSPGEWVYFLDDTSILHYDLVPFIVENGHDLSNDGLLFNMIAGGNGNKKLPDICFRISTLKGLRISFSRFIFISAWLAERKYLKTDLVLSYHHYLD